MKLPKYDSDPVIHVPPPVSLTERRDTNRTLIWTCVDLMLVLFITLLAVLFHDVAPEAVHEENSVSAPAEFSRPREQRPLHDRCAFECQRDCASPEACTIMKESYE